MRFIPPVVVISWLRKTRLTWSKEMFSRGWYSCTLENTEDWDLLMKHQSGKDDLQGELEEGEMGWLQISLNTCTALVTALRSL